MGKALRTYQRWQSGFYGLDRDEVHRFAEIVEAHPGEIAFAPKELRLANDLSERLGYTTVRSPSRSRPTGLSRGHRSVSGSDQRRALLLPQELMQLPAEEMLVLRAGPPPVRARKIRHYRDRAFRHRVSPPPAVPPLAPCRAEPPIDDGPAPRSSAPALTLEALAPTLAADGFEPVPPEGATPDEIEAWVVRFIDASAQRAPEGGEDGRHRDQHR